MGLFSKLKDKFLFFYYSQIYPDLVDVYETMLGYPYVLMIITILFVGGVIGLIQLL